MLDLEKSIQKSRIEESRIKYKEVSRIKSKEVSRINEKQFGRPHRKPSFLLKLFLKSFSLWGSLGEALAHDLVGFHDDHEGVGIHLFHRLLD